jgi:hypothetical protein
VKFRASITYVTSHPTWRENHGKEVSVLNTIVLRPLLKDELSKLYFPLPDMTNLDYGIYR